MLQPQQSLQPEVHVLDSRRFSSLSQLRAAASCENESSLLLVSQDEMTEVLTWIGDEDDVCCHDDLPALIEHRKYCLQLRIEGELDQLTRVFTRQKFNIYLSQMLAEASPEHPVSAILTDLDHFKTINDEFGHHVGDEVLRAVGKVLKDNCDRSAAVGRVGGEEFGIVCNRDAAAAMMLAEEIRHQVTRIIVEPNVSFTTSFGLATTTQQISDTEILSQASQSLYSAKANGRNCSVAFCELEQSSRESGSQVEVIGLENQARVLAERVANVITMRSRQILKTVRQEADTDSLTGCVNRRCLDRRLADEFDNRNDNSLTVAFFDLDYFGQVNKEFGWPTGDKLLVDVCDCVRDQIRETDWLGRYGGEEFCIVMPNTPLEHASQILDRIRETIERTEFKSVDEKIVPMTISVGIAETIEGLSSYSELLDHASDRALSAKRKGRNQICTQ